MTPAIVMEIPPTLADRYKGRGLALAAINEETIVDLVYIRDILPNPDDDPEGVPWDDGRPESLWLLAVDPRIGSAALKLQKAGGYVLAGMVATWEFVAQIELTPPVGATTVLLDPGNEGEPGSLWTQDEANSAWKTELRVASNSFDIIIVGGHPQWEDVSAACEVFIRRVDGSPPVRIHTSDEKNWMEARRIATVAMRVANAARGA